MTEIADAFRLIQFAPSCEADLIAIARLARTYYGGVRFRAQVCTDRATHCSTGRDHPNEDKRMKRIPTHRIKVLALCVISLALTSSTASAQNAVVHDTVDIDGVEVFYREAGPKDAPDPPRGAGLASHRRNLAGLQEPKHSCDVI